MARLTIKDVECVAFTLAEEKHAFKEPIPDFATRYPQRLESCLAAPFQTYGKKPLYKGLYRQASVLFYLMIKNHPFQNGNRRIAMTTLFVFLALNKKWLKIDVQGLYNFTVWVASSPASVKDDIINAIEKFMKQHAVDMEK